MATLIIQENGASRTRSAVNGEEITVAAPCNCTEVTGVQIAGVQYPFYDACGNNVSNISGKFSEGSLIRVLIDTTNTRAQIINQASASITNETKALFGLGADAVPDDVFSWIGYYNKHIWNKRTYRTEAGYSEKRTLYTGNSGYYITQGNSRTIQVATELSINQSTGAVSLKNPVNLTSNSKGLFTSYSSASALMGYLRGKYVKGLYDIDTYSEPILYLDNQVTITQEYNDAYNIYITYSEAQKHVYLVASQYFSGTHVGEWQVISADAADTYPTSGIVDGYEYRYVGVPFENLKLPNVQIATGSYTGTGAYGASNPNSLTFGFAPKLLIAQGLNHSAVMVLQGVSDSYATDKISWGAGVTAGVLNVKVVNSTVYWYSTNQLLQLNANATYNYVAIG